MLRPLSFLVAAGLVAGCATVPDDGLTQLQRSVKSDALSVGVTLTDEQVRAASTGQLTQASMAMNSSSGEREPSNGKKRAKIRRIFELD